MVCLTHLLPYPLAGSLVSGQLQPVSAAQRNKLWVIANSRAIPVTLVTPRTFHKLGDLFTNSEADSAGVIPSRDIRRFVPH